MNTEPIEKYAMLPRGARVLCAVSGGADSMCLLHYLWTNREKYGIELAAAHYEHGLRGEESLRDCRFVEGVCRRMDIPFFCEHGDVAGYAREHGLGTEEAARTLRYEFLRRCAEKQHCDRIATAHNADDNAETILFNLTRGSGAAGLRGIPPVRGEIIRPLLYATRAEIEAYLRENGVPHVEDSSNGSDDYSRNLIRHRVTPVLREINPDFAKAAGRAGELLRCDEDCLDALAKSFIETHFDGESVPTEALCREHRAVSSRVVRMLCERKLSAEHVDAVLRFSEGTELAYLDLPGQRLRREQGRLYFCCPSTRSIEPTLIGFDGNTRISGTEFVINCRKEKYLREVNTKFKTFCFKCESICGDVICTSRRDGDRFRPRGRGCTKTLKALFTQAKLPSTERETTPILRDDGGILAVYGFGADERGEPSIGDEVYVFSIEKI